MRPTTAVRSVTHDPAQASPGEAQAHRPTSLRRPAVRRRPAPRQSPRVRRHRSGRAMSDHGGVRESAVLPGYDDLIVVLETLPLLIRETRRRKGLSLRAAGNVLGVTHPTIMRWERGETVGLG